MKFLCEVNAETEMLIEEKNGKKDYYITGPMMQGNIQNGNGRFYPTELLVREMNRYMEEQVKPKRTNSLGELNHPDTIQVNMERTSHRIVEMWQDGDIIMGKAKIMDTPMGKIVKTHMDEGIQFGVSTRGFGTLKESENGYKEVQPDFHLATIDIVSNPSAPSAWMNAVMESKNFALHEGMIVEVNEATERAILEKHGCGCDTKEHIKLGPNKIDEVLMIGTMEQLLESFLQEEKHLATKLNGQDMHHLRQVHNHLLPQEPTFGSALHHAGLISDDHVKHAALYHLHGMIHHSKEGGRAHEVKVHSNKLDKMFRHHLKVK